MRLVEGRAPRGRTPGEIVVCAAAWVEYFAERDCSISRLTECLWEGHEVVPEYFPHIAVGVAPMEWIGCASGEWMF